MFIVTGANGFIGSALVWELNKAGIKDIVCSDYVSLNEREEPLGKRSFNSFETPERLLDELTTTDLMERVIGIFHLGGSSSTMETNEDYLKEVNTDYTRKLFELCTQYKVPFIYASSAATYGNGEKGFSDMVSPEEYTPLNPYGRSKLNFDKWVVKQIKVPPKWFGLRFFNVYGPNEYHKGFMASMVYKGYFEVKESGRRRLFRSYNANYENGKAMRDFIYVKDITRWMLELYNTTAESGIYNMGYGKARTWLDLARATFSAMGKEVDIEWEDMPLNLRQHYQYFTEADMTKWYSQNLSPPEWSLEMGVKDYIQNYLIKNDKPTCL